MSDTKEPSAKDKAIELAKKEGITVAAAAERLKPKPSFKVKPKPKVSVDAEPSTEPPAAQ